MHFEPKIAPLVTVCVEAVDSDCFIIYELLIFIEYYLLIIKDEPCGKVTSFNVTLKDVKTSILFPPHLDF